MRGWLGLCGVACCVAACAESVGPLFVARDDAEPPAEAGPELPDDAGDPLTTDAAEDAGSELDAGDAGSALSGKKLQYQLTGTLDASADAGLFVVDLFDTPRAQIDALHALGKVVIAFVAAGSYEPWRPDVAELPRSVRGQPLAGYPNENWLDVRDPSVRQLLVSRITLAAGKGFDGVLLVSLDAYLADSGFALTPEDQLAYNLWLAEQAARAGLYAGISSDWRHAGALAARYDFAIHLNCLANQRCAELDPYRARQRAVFDLETTFDTAEATCAAARRANLAVTLKREAFDAWLLACP